MAREEVIGIIRDRIYSSKRCTIDIENDAIKICSIFESRTCENCKYIGAEFKGKYGRSQYECHNGIGFDICSYTQKPYVNKSFGCNEWKSKENK